MVITLAAIAVSIRQSSGWQQKNLIIKCSDCNYIKWLDGIGKHLNLHRLEAHNFAIKIQLLCTGGMFVTLEKFYREERKRIFIAKNF